MKLKNILSLSALTGLMILSTGCTEEKIITVDPNGLAQAGDYNVLVSVNDETNEFTLALDRYDGVYPVWTVYANPSKPETPSIRTTSPTVTGVIRVAGDYDVEVKIGNRNGISDGTRTAVIHIDKDLDDASRFKGYKYDSEFNMWKNANVSLQSTWFADDGWGELNPQPTVEVDNETISFHTPADMGNSQWQGQVHIGTDIQVSSEETYDFSCYIESIVDSKVTVKVQMDGDDNTFFVADVQEFSAGGSAYFFSDLPGFDGTLKIAFDFGGNPDTDFTISNIVFKNHKDDDGTILPDVAGEDDSDDFGGFDPASSVNQWTNAVVSLQSTWFADDGWGELNPQPEVKVSNEGIFLHTPSGMGGSQWQGQVHVGTNIEVSADQFYDFSCRVYTSEGGKVTVKVQKDGDDDTMFGDMGNQKEVKAGDNIIYFINEAGFDGTLKIAFDFGGLIDQDIEVTDIVFKNHNDDDGTELPVVWNEENNLWKGYDVGSIYYATGSSWDGLPDYEYERTEDGYFVSLPTETMSQWQAQMHIPTDIMTSSENNYDFKITFNCSNTIEGVTVKLHPEGDDGTMYMEDRVACEAGKDATYKWTNMPGIDADVPWVLTLDFGGNPANTDIVVSGIHFQVH